MSINGVQVSELIDGIYQHIVAQGHVKTTKNHVFNKLSSGLIPYALNLPVKYTITIQGQKEAITLTHPEKAIGTYWDYLQYCQNQLCLEFPDDKNRAYDHHIVQLLLLE